MPLSCPCHARWSLPCLAIASGGVQLAMHMHLHLPGFFYLQAVLRAISRCHAILPGTVQLSDEEGNQTCCLLFVVACCGCDCGCCGCCCGCCCCFCCCSSSCRKRRFWRRLAKRRTSAAPAAPRAWPPARRRRRRRRRLGVCSVERMLWRSPVGQRHHLTMGKENQP